MDDNLNIEHSPSKEDALLGNEESAEEMEVVKKKKKKKNKKEGHDESLVIIVMIFPSVDSLGIFPRNTLGLLEITYHCLDICSANV